MATKSSIGSLGLNFEDTIKSLSKVATTAGQVDKAFAGITGSSARYIDNITKSLKDLTSVSDKLPTTSKALRTVFDSVDGLRVHKEKAAYIEDVAKSLSKFYIPLQVLSQLNIGPAATNISNLFTSFEKIPSKTRVDNLNAFSDAIRKFSAATKTLSSIPSNVSLNFMGGGGGGGRGSGGGGGGAGTGTGGGGVPAAVPPFAGFPASPGALPSFQGVGQAVAGPWPPSLGLPAYGGTGVAPAPPPAAAPPPSLGGRIGTALGNFTKNAIPAMPVVYALWDQLKERSTVNEQLGSVSNFNLGILGMGGTKGTAELQRGIDTAAMMHAISYADAASQFGTYRRYSSGGMRATDMTSVERNGVIGGVKVEDDFEKYVGNSRRMQRQLGIDLDLAADIQGSVRKNLQLNAEQFKQFGDSMAYLSRSSALSKKEVIELNREIQTMGVVTGRSGEGAKAFSQDMMVSAATLSEVGVGGSALSSIQKGFTGNMTNYLLNKQMGITSTMRSQDQVMAQQQFIAARVQSLAGMDPETRNLMIGMMQSKGLLPADMSLEDITKLSQASPIEMRRSLDQHTDKIREEAFVQGQSLPNVGGSLKNITKSVLPMTGHALGRGISALKYGLNPLDPMSYSLADTYNMVENAEGMGVVKKDSTFGGLPFSASTATSPISSNTNSLSSFSRSIAQIEGFYAGGKNPNRPQRNLNPGNLRVAGWSPNMDPEKAMRMAKIQGAVGYDKDGYLRFGSSEAGFAGLERQIRIDAKRGMDVGSFVEKYAPATENNTEGYKAFLGKAGFGSGTSLQEVLGRSSTQISSADNSFMSQLGNIFNFSQSPNGPVTKETGGTGTGVDVNANASIATAESASKFTQAADVMLQAAQTLSVVAMAQSSKGSPEYIYRMARGNMER